MYNKIIKDENKGYFSEEEIREFIHKDCDDYLNCHTKEELNQMPLRDKQELILELEFNFQN